MIWQSKRPRSDRMRCEGANRRYNEQSSRHDDGDGDMDIVGDRGPAGSGSGGGGVGVGRWRWRLAMGDGLWVVEMAFWRKCTSTKILRVPMYF